jgi:hypothetical protein
MAAIRRWTRAGALLSRSLRRHRHRPDPDLSALVSFPSCRCGELLWPEPGQGRGGRFSEPDGRDLDRLHGR